VTMLGAGHETTATGLAFAFELLLRNRRALARLREELEAGQADAYLDAVVKESLRLRPVIDAAERTLTVPRTVAGWQLPAGVKVYPGIALVHLREDLYERAHEFRPERFVDEGAESYSWLPFGGGIRRCIGAALAQAEMAEVLRVAVPAAQLRPLRDRPDPVVLRGITLAPRHGVPVVVERVRSAPAFSARPLALEGGNGGAPAAAPGDGQAVVRGVGASHAWQSRRTGPNATTVGAVGLTGAIVAAVYAGQQVREARRGRQAQMAAEFIRRWNEDALVEARRLIDRFQTPQELSAAFQRYVASGAPEAYVLYRELDYFEQLGALEQRGAFDFELIRLLLGRTLATRWEMWKPAVEAAHGAGTYHMFEALAGKIRAAADESSSRGGA